ncbi:hypothetical protein [Pseudomonas cichorii]|uniref:hypothetical protein n=1 Tax=Pseudomonas cichorii TaxID=36746 RepID=UPI001C8A1988|nr:hypothetical protein [Pseudomonas cichorii]MBX8577851.1 hypothetical protein [Pseudomonas cichorii]
MNSTPFALTIFIGLTIGIMRFLADTDIKKNIFYWTLIGIFMGVLKSLIIRITPQWLDAPIDSLTYKLHAEAIYMHWTGLPVDASAYKLSGYLNGWSDIYGSIWLPDATISYTGVLGTHEWVYSAFLASWQFISSDWVNLATLANAIIAGALPAAAFMITRELGGSVKISHIGALLIALDPSLAINSSWLIKDTLAAFLSAIVIISTCSLYKRPSIKSTIILALSLGMLAGIRYAAFIAFGVVFFGLIVVLAFKKSQARALAFSLASILALTIWGGIYFSAFSQTAGPVNAPTSEITPSPLLVQTPNSTSTLLKENTPLSSLAQPPAPVSDPLIENKPIPSLIQTLGTVSEPLNENKLSLVQTPNQLLRATSGLLQGQAQTLTADKGDSGADKSVIEWRAYLQDSPVKAVLRSIVRTLFAPYPWTAITQKITGKNHIELYVFGTFFWVLTLPGLFIGMIIAAKQGIKTYVLLLFLTIMTAAYIVFFGEWSTRQRVFMEPLFFSFAAIGWHKIWSWGIELKRSYFKTFVSAP